MVLISRDAQETYAHDFVRGLNDLGGDKLEVVKQFVFPNLVIIHIRCDDPQITSQIREKSEVKAFEVNSRAYAIGRERKH